jgi:hypothetical protein
MSLIKLLLLYFERIKHIDTEAVCMSLFTSPSIIYLPIGVSGAFYCFKIISRKYSLFIRRDQCKLEVHFSNFLVCER